MSIRAQLRTSINRGVTEIEVMPLAILDSFPAAGNAYISDDKFSYTGISSGKLTGCSGLDYSHEEGEFITLTYGASYSRLLPNLFKVEENDPDRVIETIGDVVDETEIEYFVDKLIGIHKLIDPNLTEESFLQYICTSLGVEFDINQSEDVKRNLARNASAVLRYRGNLNAFKFIVYHTLGYEVDVTINKSRIYSQMGNINYRMMKEPTEFSKDNRTVGLWRFSEGAGTSVANEISGGNPCILHNAAMWVTTPSMFSKDTLIKLDNVNTYAKIGSIRGQLGNVKSKENFAIEIMVNPTTSVNFPQTIIYKSNLILVSRPNSTDIEITMTDGVSTFSKTFTDCITIGKTNYLSILYSKPILTLCVDGDIVDYDITFDLNSNLYDGVGDWIIGDDGMVPINFEGYVELMMISSGKKYPSECFDYFYHIIKLRTHNMEPDYNSYMLNFYKGDIVAVTICDSDGDLDKENFLKYLIQEWLTIGSYYVEQSGNLPLEIELEMF